MSIHHKENIMKDVPEWITKLVDTESLRCNKCKDRLGKGHLISVGIQSSSIKPHDDTLCIGLYCNVCKEITIFELKEMSLIEFAFEILERETEPKKTMKKEDKSIKRNVIREMGGVGGKRRLKASKSKITRKEINESIRFLKNVKTHEEFLVAMGMSPEQICYYSYKKTKKG